MPLLHDPPAVFLLCLLGTTLGWRVLRVLRAPLQTVSRLERGVLSAAIGLGMLQYLGLGLGLVHALTPRNLAVGLVFLALALLPDTARIVRACFRSARVFAIALPRVARSQIWLTAAVGLVGILLAVAFFQSLCPCTDADGLAYHLRAPKQWLRTGSLDFLPTLTTTNSPMGVEMLYTLLLALWSDTSAKLIHFALGLLSLLAMFALGRRLRGAQVGLVVSLLFVAGLPKCAALPLFTYAYIEMGLTLQVVCGVIAWFAWQRTRARGWLLCAALCAGFAFSFKLTGLLFLLAPALLTIGEGQQRLDAENNVKKVKPDGWQNALLFVSVALLPALPWLLRSWALTGNPIYPVMPGLFPTRDWNAAHGKVFTSYLRLYNWGSTHEGWSRSLRQSLLLIVMSGYGLGACLLWRKWKDADARRLLFLTTLPTLGIMAGTGLYIRYLIPLLPLHLLLLCWNFEPAPDRGKRLPTGQTLLRASFVLLLAVNSLLYVRAASPSLAESLHVVTGRLSRTEYLNRHHAPMPLWTYANTHLSAEAHILVAGFGDTYYCDPYCYCLKAFNQTRLRLDTWEHFLADVQRDRIGYLVVVPDAAPRPEYGPDYLPARNMNVFPQRLARLYGQPLASASDLVLYRLTLPLSPSLESKSDGITP